MSRSDTCSSCHWKKFSTYKWNLYFFKQSLHWELQRHSRTDEQPCPPRHRVQHQGQRQWPLHLPVRPALLWGYALAVIIHSLLWIWKFSISTLPLAKSSFSLCGGIKLQATYIRWHRCCLSGAWICHFPSTLICLFGRLVVWSVWPLQSQWHILPQLDQHDALQQH